MDQSMMRMSQLLKDLSWEFGAKRFDVSLHANLTFVEYMTLTQIIRCKEIPSLTLAARMGISKGGMSKIIDRLEQKGFAKRERNRVDGRVCCVVPSEKAEKVVEQCEEQSSIFLSELLEGAEPHQIDMLRSSLEYVAAKLERSQQSVSGSGCCS